LDPAGEFDADIEDSERRRNPLRAFGIEPDEEAVYRLLLEAPGCTLAELDERSSLATERLPTWTSSSAGPSTWNST
jgi:hypothetical protein